MIFGVLDKLSEIPRVKFKDILILVVNCNLFNQMPALSAKLLDIHIYLYTSRRIKLPFLRM